MKHAITLRIDDALLQAARHRAQTENRSLTNLVETILKRHIAAPVVEAPATRAAANVKRPIPRKATDE